MWRGNAPAQQCRLYYRFFEGIVGPMAFAPAAFSGFCRPFGGFESARSRKLLYSRVSMRPLINAVWTACWTAVITIGGATSAKLRRDDDVARRAERYWAKGLLRAWGVDVEIGGAALDSGAPYIVMANHQSHVDVPILFMALPFVPGFLAKKELARIPVLSLALRAGRHVLIDRSDQGSALGAIKTAAAEIRDGKTIVVFPEGTRGDGTSLGAFKKGGFLIAKRAGVPIVPVGISGTASVLPRGSWLPRASHVRVRIGEPIEPSAIKSMKVGTLQERVRSEISRLVVDESEQPVEQAPRAALRPSA